LIEGTYRCVACKRFSWFFPIGSFTRPGLARCRVFFAGMEAAVSFALVGALVGEFVAGELRAMTNYAGYRLSPWLGHLMVSRQETSRPLLTPGDVMQLSPHEAIVMVSGVHPVRARKVGYYEDPQFQRRMLKPSRTAPFQLAARPDDWSGRTPIPPSIELLAVLKRKVRDPNGGIRREPELPQHEEVMISAPLAENEFDTASDGGDADVLQARALRRAMRGLARSASLDPDDKMDL
jgi:type IV secretion system protein VirD4